MHLRNKPQGDTEIIEISIELITEIHALLITSHNDKWMKEPKWKVKKILDSYKYIHKLKLDSWFDRVTKVKHTRFTRMYGCSWCEPLRWTDFFISGKCSIDGLLLFRD